MAQPHKGERKQIAAILDPAVRAEIWWRAQVLGVSPPDYISGIAAIALGRPDLAGRVTQISLMTIPEREDHDLPSSGYITPRIASPVYQLIRAESVQLGISMGSVLSEILTEHIHGSTAHRDTRQADLLTSA